MRVDIKPSTGTSITINPTVNTITVNSPIPRITSIIATEIIPIGNFITYRAGIALGGNRVVRTGFDGSVVYASSAILSDANSIIGITVGAANQNQDVIIQIFGELIEPSWNWVSDQSIFLGLNGLLTQTPPNTGFCIMIGTAVNPTKINVSIKQPIIL